MRECNAKTDLYLLTCAIPSQINTSSIMTNHHRHFGNIISQILIDQLASPIAAQLIDRSGA